jgi:L-alanine-DL-glutamate epimerase-like enolase superfamily enzyme
VVIAECDFGLYRVPPATRWEDATLQVSELEFLVARISTDAGIEGIGFSYTLGAGGTTIKNLLTDHCQSALIGSDPFERERIWHLLCGRLRRLASGGISALAIAAVDIALWDLVAKALRIPLFRLLGRNRSRIPVYVSGIDLGMDCDELRKHLLDQVQKGYQAVKIKVGKPHLQEDLERVATAREVLGSEIALLVDANQAWQLHEAIERLNAFEPYHPFCIEEPLPKENISGHAELRRTISIPIAVGESLYSRHQFQEYLRSEAVDILQPDVARVGGITEWLKIASLAEAWNRTVMPHYLRELSVHLLCEQLKGGWLEDIVGGSLRDMGLVRDGESVQEGWTSPPERPGHGIEFYAGALRTLATDGNGSREREAITRQDS